MILRRLLLAAGAAATLGPRTGLAQPARRMVRIGVLIPASAASYAPRLDALRDGLRQLGHAEGRTFSIELRAADDNYDRLPALASELVDLEVDLIVTAGTNGTRAAKRATSDIPIVMAVSGDAVSNGLIASLARPGGNISGTTYFDPELHVKRLELLRDAVPSLRRLGILMNPDNPQNSGSTLQAARHAADSMKLELVVVPARTPRDFEAAFATLAKERVEGVSVADDPMLLGNLRTIAELAATNRLPSAGAREFPPAGGLLGYGVDFVELWRRAAYFVDKIVKGASPRDLPVERPTKFAFVINLRTAQKLGLAIPKALALRAETMIR